MQSGYVPAAAVNLDPSFFNVVRTYDFVCYSDVCAVSKNGNFFKNCSKGEVTIDAAGATNTWLSIGCRRSTTGVSSKIADVKIHAVRIYNRQLSDAELAANAEIDSLRFAVGLYVAPNRSGSVYFLR